jgi:DNA-binding transcriptional regulator YhcF (GntR family)
VAGNKQKDKGPRHVRICHYMMDSQAWKSLGAIARAIYPHIAKRYAGVGSNNGRIGYSVREASAEFHIGTSTAKRALDELQDRGFIVAMKKGAFSLKQRNSTEWRLTEFHCDVTNKLATKDFMTWTPDKNKTRYPQRHRSVSAAAPIGTHRGTVPDSDTSHGTCSGTVNGGLAA